MSKYPMKDVTLMYFEATWLEDRAEEKNTTVDSIMEFIIEHFGDEIKAELVGEEF